MEISNIVFTSMFALEMLLKLLAFGLFGYIKNPYNIFDGIIVVIRSVPVLPPLWFVSQGLRPVGDWDGEQE